MPRQELIRGGRRDPDQRRTFAVLASDVHGCTAFKLVVVRNGHGILADGVCLVAGHSPLFEALCFQNGLGGRRGKEWDQRSCGVNLTAADNDPRGELGVILDR